MWHSSGFPGLVAGLCHQEPHKVTQVIAKIRLCVEAQRWCLTMGCSTAADMARRAMLKSQLMDWVTAQLEKDGWTAVNAVLQEFLSEMWGHGAQTVSNERINQKLRDLEERTSPSKCSARATRWETAARCGILEQWGRTPIQPEHSESPLALPTEKLDALFKAPGSLDSELDLGHILHEVDWGTSWTAQTQKRAFLEQELMNLAFTKQDKGLISKSWQTGLLPVGQVVGMREHGVPGGAKGS